MTNPTRVQFTQSETYLVDALRYAAKEVQGAPTVHLMLIGGSNDRQTVSRLGLTVAGELGLSLEVGHGGDLFVVGITSERAEHGADRLVAEIQRKLDPRPPLRRVGRRHDDQAEGQIRAQRRGGVKAGAGLGRSAVEPGRYGAEGAGSRPATTRCPGAAQRAAQQQARTPPPRVTACIYTRAALAWGV
jgi:hypothetical protein